MRSRVVCDGSVCDGSVCDSETLAVLGRDLSSEVRVRRTRPVFRRLSLGVVGGPTHGC